MQPLEMTTLLILSSPIKSPYNDGPPITGGESAREFPEAMDSGDNCPPQIGHGPGDGGSATHGPCQEDV
jgi:hypothetical protein